MSWRDSGNDSWSLPTSKTRVVQLNESYCLTANLEKIREKFKKESWFIDIFLTTPNYLFPYVHICVLCKKVYEGFNSTAVEFVEVFEGKLLDVLEYI